MAPKNVTKKKLRLNNTKPHKKSAKIVSKPVETETNDHDDSNDSDGSLDAIEFDSEYIYILKIICYTNIISVNLLGASDHDASLSEDDGKVYDSDDLDDEVEKLKTSDPEFYKYLKECDKNLAKMSQSNDDDDDDGGDDDDYDEDDVEGIKSEKLHKPPMNLEVSNMEMFV